MLIIYLVSCVSLFIIFMFYFKYHYDYTKSILLSFFGVVILLIIMNVIFGIVKLFGSLI